MDNLSNLAYTVIPALGLLTLGAIWLAKSVFKDVSLNDERSTDNLTAIAEERAEGLELQRAIAEDLEADPATLNALTDSVERAHADVRVARDAAERARQIAERTEEEGRRTNQSPGTVPWFSPVAAAHIMTPNSINESPSRFSR
ncbi:hypothetical protein KF728_17805 [Candidatus Obscuribacterales bacterium]|nr:hypothetical protein [Candidatus Obscuribacterales bacterium]